MNIKSFFLISGVLISLFLFTGSGLFTLEEELPTPSNSLGTYYVLAPDGLDLHTSSYTSSVVIRHIPYGGKVELIKNATTLNLKIDRIESGMAQVTYNGKLGYVFEGYLSRFPAPKNLRSLKSYVNNIRENKINIYFEEDRKDWSKKKFDHQFKMYLPTSNWIEAFLISQQLLDIPDRVFIPKQWGEPNEQKEYKNDLENLENETLRLYYNDKGFLETLIYEHNGIGEKKIVTLTFVEKDEDKKQISVEQVLKIDK